MGTDWLQKILERCCPRRTNIQQNPIVTELINQLSPHRQEHIASLYLNDPQALEQVASYFKSNGYQNFQLIGVGTGSLCFDVGGAVCIKMGRPNQAFEYLNKVKIAKPFLPLEQDVSTINLSQNGANVIYKTRKLLSAQDIIESAHPLSGSVRDQQTKFKDILRMMFIKDSLLAGDSNNNNIMFLADANGRPVVVSDDNGGQHFVPIYSDYERIKPIANEYLLAYEAEAQQPLPEIVELWIDAIQQHRQMSAAISAVTTR